MAENTEGSSGNAGRQRSIKTRETVKDVRVIEKGQNLSGHLKETFVRTKENTKSVLDDSQDDGTGYREAVAHKALEDLTTRG